MSFQQKLLQDENRIRDALLDSKSSVFSENPQSPTPFGRDQWLGSILSLNGGNVDIEGFLNDLGTDAWKEITNFSEATKSVIDEAYDWITTDGLGDTITQLTTFIGTISGTAAEWLATQGSIIWTAVKGASEWIGDTLRDTVDTIWANLVEQFPILGTLQATIDSITASIPDISQTVIDNINTIAEAAGDFFTDASTWISDNATALWTGIKTAATWLKDSLSAVAIDVWNYITGSISSFAGTIGDALGEVWTTITGIFNELGAELTSFFSEPVDWLTGKASAIWTAMTNNISNFATTVWNYLKDNIPLVGNLATFIGTITSTASVWATTLWTAGSDFVTAAVSWLGNSLDSSLTTLLGDTWTAIKNLSTGFINTINGLSEAATSLLSNPSTWINTWLTDNIGSFINAIWSGITGGFPVIHADPDTATAAGSAGDIDMGTYDITNVDRVFFNSNNGLDTDSERPHISSYNTTTNNSWLQFFIPNNSRYDFQIGGSGSVMSLQGLQLDIAPNTFFAKSIRVGSGVSADNGHIGLDGNDVIIRSGGKNINISNAVLTEETTTTVGIQNSASYSNPGNSSLETFFGDERGSIGLWCDTDLQTSESSRVYLWVKSEYYWFGIRADSIVDTTRNLDGESYEGSSTKKRVKTTEGNTHTPLVSDVGGEDGRLYCHQQIGDEDDGAFGIVRALTETTFTLYGHRFTRPHVNEISTTDDSGTTQELLDTIPVISISSSNESTSSLDEGFGTAEGSLGYNKNTDKFFAKINGYWWRWNFSLGG